MALRIDNLTKRFPKSAERGNGRKRSLALFQGPKKKFEAAVDAVSLTIQPGEIFGVLGANGSGKSTLIRMISTLLLPDEGRVEVFGLDVVQRSIEVRRLLNRVSADASFFKKLSAWDNLLHSARLYSVPIETAKDRLEMILKLMDFPAWKASAPVQHLSRGMQQKLAIARAFLTSPVLLLLDEPTTGLDVKARRDVQKFILEVREKHNATILLTTHDMAEAESLCDRIALLRSGKIVTIGTPKELRSGSGIAASSSMEDVFIALVGESMEEQEIEK